MTDVHIFSQPFDPVAINLPQQFMISSIEPDPPFATAIDQIEYEYLNPLFKSESYKVVKTQVFRYEFLEKSHIFLALLNLFNFLIVGKQSIFFWSGKKVPLYVCQIVPYTKELIVCH